MAAMEGMTIPASQVQSQTPVFFTIPQQNGSVSEKEHINKVFPKKSMLVTSSLQITCGAFAALTHMILLGLTHETFPSVIGVGLWTGFFFGLAGGIGLIAMNRPSSCTVVAYMVLSIIASLNCLILLIFSGIGFGSYRSWRHGGDGVRVIYALHILVALVEAVTAITASAFCCRAVCCGKRHYPGTVIFAPNAGQFQGASGANVEFTAIPLSTVAPSVSSSNTYEKPPDYEESATLKESNGEKYQRFE